MLRFFPSRYTSPAGVESLAFYHRPTLQLSVKDARGGPHRDRSASSRAARGHRDRLRFARSRASRHRRASAASTETHRLTMPPANWGAIKVGRRHSAGARRRRLAVGHARRRRARPAGRRVVAAILRGHHHPRRRAARPHRSSGRTSRSSFPKRAAELHGAVGHVVFPTGIDQRSEREFDIYYGMADYEIARGRLTLAEDGP